MRMSNMLSSLLLASALVLPGIPASAAEAVNQAPVPDRVILVELPPVKAGEESTSVIEADEPLIAALLSVDPENADYEAVTLEEITSSETGADGMTLCTIPVTDNAEIVLWQNAGGVIQETSLTGVDVGAKSTDSVAAVSYFSGTNHWLAVKFTAKDAETAEITAETEIVEETAEETAAESLEGKTEPEADEAKAKATKAAETAKAATKAQSSTTKAQSTTKAAETKATTAPTKATTAPTKATSAPTTAAPTKGTTKAAETTAPTTTAHVHSWVPVTKTVHHDAVTRQVWVVDQAAYDETVVVTPAYDEQVQTQAAWDETVVVTPAYDEPVYDWQQVCNVCGYVFPIGTSGDVILHHEDIDPGCGGGWHAIQVQVGSTHHDAVTQVVHHDAVYTTVHHDAVTTNVHHEEKGHYETVTDKAAYDETVTTGYKCSVCGATK